MRASKVLVTTSIAAALCVALGMFGSSCSGDPEHCRFDPECGGGIGSFCDVDADCDDGFCCRDGSNCAGGMCTYECRDDRDCPADMRCRHDMCFYSCASDADCARGMSCEHDNTVCEWP